jgi:iron(III) transport system substrate-binding protein
MAEDYKKVFGKDIELASDEPNAGYAFIKRFAQNSPIFESSSGGIVKNVGTKGQKKAPVGYAASSKMREAVDQGFALGSDPVNFSPAVAIYGLNILEIVNEAPHPNAAKLLIRFLNGEADGKGPGFKPFNTQGGWSARSIVPLAEGNIPFNDIPLFETDLDYVYENIQNVQDYWLSVQP